jgi:hypothetical protein
VKRGSAARNRHNIVLTGPVRSGTTLSVYLLSRTRNTIALNEPMLPGKLYMLMPDKDAICDGVEKFYRRTRRRVRTERKAVSKHIGGKLTDASYGEPNAIGKRESLLEKGVVSIDKEVAEHFDLVVKHPGTFTALLPQLKHRFPCYAVVRNPLSIMASRSSIGQQPDASTDGKTGPHVQRPIFAKDQLRQHVRRGVQASGSTRDRRYVRVDAEDARLGM